MTHLACKKDSVVQEHLNALHTSSKLTLYFQRMHQPKAARVTSEKVIAVLHKAGIRCVLMGTHGVGGYRSEPRATQDVDALVPKKEVRMAVRSLQRTYSK